MKDEIKEWIADNPYNGKTWKELATLHMKRDLFFEWILKRLYEQGLDDVAEEFERKSSEILPLTPNNKG
jgi:hypothetical protein